MGLISKVISAAPKVWNYTKRAVKAAPDVIFGKGADTFVRSTATGVKDAIKANGSLRSSVWSGLKTGGRALESSIAQNAVKNGGFFKQAWNSLKSLPSTIFGSTKAGVRAAKMAGKSSLGGGIKGFFKGVGKKMPLLGNLMLVAFELPNIFKATKEQGVGQGAAEVVKAGGRLAGGALGSAVGSMICPGLGSLVGWVAGEWLASKIVGKSYTEKQEELAQKQQEAYETAQQLGYIPATEDPQNPQTQTLNDPVAFGGNPAITNPFQPYQNPYDMMNGGYYNGFGNPYADDIMMKGLKFNTMM